MIDKLFSKINQHNLTDWGVVLLGVTGVPGIGERLNYSLVEDFANATLKEMPIDDPLLDVVVELATNRSATSSELRENLEVLCHAKNVDINKSKRKWRYASLENVISDLDLDPVYGLITLSEFWAAWDWPSDSPTTMRSDSEISPEDYHSESNYESVVKNNRDWLVLELASLKNTG